MNGAPTFSHGLPDYLSDQQIAQLLRAINPLRVSKDGKGFSHVEAYDVRAHLTRIFGFARWSEEVISQDLVFESAGSGEKPKWTVAYRSMVRLTIHAPSGARLAVYTEGAIGDASNQPSRADAHDLSLKMSASQALKRSATNLGDQFALSLYGKGSMSPLVKMVLTGAPQEQIAEANADAADVSEHITTPLAPENGEPETSQRETSSPPEVTAKAPTQPADPAVSPAASTGEDPQLAAARAATSEQDQAWVWILEQITGLEKRVSPAEGLAVLTKCMEVSVRRGLRARKMPDSNVTLGAHLAALMARAKAATSSTAVAS